MPPNRRTKRGPVNSRQHHTRNLRRFQAANRRTTDTAGSVHCLESSCSRIGTLLNFLRHQCEMFTRSLKAHETGTNLSRFEPRMKHTVFRSRSSRLCVIHEIVTRSKVSVRAVKFGHEEETDRRSTNSIGRSMRDMISHGFCRVRHEVKIWISRYAER